MVVDGALDGAGGLGGVGPGFADGAGGLVGDVVPAVDGGALAEGGGVVAVFAVAVAGALGVGVGHIADAVGGIGGAAGAGQADIDQAFAGGEDNAAVLVVPGVGFVLAHDGELYTVDGEQLIQGEAEGLGDEDVDFQQGLAAGVVAAQGVVALPVGGQLTEEVLGQRLGAGVVAIGWQAPLLLLEGGVPATLPELAVVGGETI